MSQFVAYVIDGHELTIRPAPVERDWMDMSDQRFAYRCLPLNIANAHGWEILCPTGFSALWDGRKTTDAVRIKCKAGTAPAVSHFGGGILTFHVPCIFRTDPGVDMFVTGPINRPKDAIAPLTGVVETDWSPYTFTMNWQFTRASQRIHFEEGEPFCHVFPVARQEIESLEPRIARLSDSPQLEAEHKAWSASRLEFNSSLSKPGSEAAREKWQKTYFRGKYPSGQDAPEDHRSKLRMAPFKPK
jgi:hypothetical protein